MSLTKDQVTKLAEAQKALDDAESLALATTICMPPLDTYPEDLNTWRANETERIVAPHRVALAELLRKAGLSEERWAEVWQGALKEISGK